MSVKECTSKSGDVNTKVPSEHVADVPVVTLAVELSIRHTRPTGVTSCAALTRGRGTAALAKCSVNPRLLDILKMQTITQEQLAKHKEIYDALLQAKAFDIKNGEVVMSFNQIGHLMSVKVNFVAYRKYHD